MLSTEKPRHHVKSFFAASVQEAMETARLEMGPDALLLGTRDAPPEARHLGDYEVIFGCLNPGSPSAEAPVPAASPVYASASAQRETTDEIIETLRRQVEEIREVMMNSGMKFPEPVAQLPSVAPWLIEAGVEPKLAAAIEAAVRQRLAVAPVARMGEARALRSDPDRLLRETREEVDSRYSVQPELGRVTALVGPPGAGKTTTLVKLAVTQGLALGHPVRLISTDTQRIGGADQLRTYAAILGVPFQAVESVAALEQAIDAAPANALVLIDTAGYSTAMLRDLAGPLAAFLSGRQGIDTHLVLTASTRLEDLFRLADLYEVFQPSKLLFTRVDEATSLASAFCVAARWKRPLSFLATGQSVPEDLEPATRHRITTSLVRELPLALEAVA